MCGQRTPFPSHDWYLRRLAERQHGVVAWWQLRAANFSRGSVDSRLARGILRHMHRGVYAFGHAELRREGRWMAAVLALGEHAVLCHRTAAALWGILDVTETSFIHVSVPTRRRTRRRERILVHERAPSVETTVHDGIPVTTVEATLLDLAVSVDRHTLGQAVDRAERGGLLDRRTWTAPRGRPGAAVLRAAVGEHRTAPTRSELERRFLMLCRDHGLPLPHVNHWVAGHEVDFWWPAHRLVVETDGRDHFEGRRQQGDLEKDAALALAGIRTQRFGWEQVVDRPAFVAEVLGTLMGA